MTGKGGLFLLFPAAMLLSSCAADIGANDYDVSNANKVNQVQPCTVVTRRVVTVRDGDNSGATLGTIAGGVAGSQIGRGSTASVLGALGGALIGGVAGDLAQEGLSTQTGYEYIVRQDNGSMVTVTQGTDVLLQPGQKCLVIYGNQARVIPYN